jgi:hypothetical protein
MYSTTKGGRPGHPVGIKGGCCNECGPKKGVTLALKEISAMVNRALIAQFRPWELLPPADWADPARCAHPGPYTAYQTAVWHCNQCGHPVTPAKISPAANRTVILPTGGPTA